jgi:hypothetical protein
LAAAVGLGLCAGFAEARADQVVLSPLSAGQFSQFPDPSLPPNGNFESTGSSFTRVTDVIRASASRPPVSDDPARYFGIGTVEFSLASLPAGAVITSATINYKITQLQYGNAPAPHLIVTAHDGVDGVATLADIGKTPSVTVLSQQIPILGVYTSTFTDLSFLNDRGNKLPSGYLGLNFSDNDFGYSESVSVAQADGPHLTITYALPEPASVGMLGVGVLMLLRRRRLVLRR